MGRFASTVEYYEAARAPYGAAFFAAVARELGLDGSQRLLDVGAGPGILTIGFAPYCREAVGVDPEPGMVAAARGAAREAGVSVAFVEGRFEDEAASLGAFDLVTIGRAVHWLDPEPARAALDRVLAADGRVLICDASSVTDGRNAWLSAYDAARRRWSGERPSRDDKGLFADGRFVLRRTIAVEARYSVTVERLADRVLSRSTSSPERLGGEVGVMRKAMSEALAPFARDGAVADIVKARAKVYVRA